MTDNTADQACLRATGKPIAIHELKTMQTTYNMMEEETIMELYAKYLNEGKGVSEEVKEDALKIFRDVLVRGKWVFKNAFEDVVMEKKTKRPYFLHRNSKLYPTEHIDRMKSTKFPVNGQTHHLLGKDVERETKDKQSPIMIDFKDYLRAPGKGKITFYDFNKWNENEPLFSCFYEKAPFMLGVASSFYTQMLMQYCCTYHLNDNMKYIFTVTVSYKKENWEPLRLAMSYSYDTGIRYDLVKPFIEGTQYYLDQYTNLVPTREIDPSKSSGKIQPLEIDLPDDTGYQRRPVSISFHINEKLDNLFESEIKDINELEVETKGTKRKVELMHADDDFRAKLRKLFD
ncbi:hypothetical protein HOLleu_43314 [Holothuria leucospilota]|uniref:Uncharacterized protein n=1 Tax=Holothuria leucospilota TaxID=206669 RepID=A0A9Q0Y9L9_HOLLE|nr:hypothetical protein HOLleu_43314 [Holothuria leucospilota]